MGVVTAPLRPAPGPCALGVCPLKPSPGGELWALLDTPGAKHRYAVSTLGRVRNADTGHDVRLQPHQNGYQVVNLGRAYRMQLVHRLVLLAFIGPARGREGDHLDFQRRHNRVTNLRWLAKDVNAWRWRLWAAEPPPEWVEPPPPTPAELAAWLASWGPPPIRRPEQQHRHLTATGATP